MRRCCTIPGVQDLQRSAFFPCKCEPAFWYSKLSESGDMEIIDSETDKLDLVCWVLLLGSRLPVSSTSCTSTSFICKMGNGNTHLSGFFVSIRWFDTVLVLRSGSGYSVGWGRACVFPRTLWQASLLCLQHRCWLCFASRLSLWAWVSESGGKSDRYSERCAHGGRRQYVAELLPKGADTWPKDGERILEEEPYLQQ